MTAVDVSSVVKVYENGNQEMTHGSNMLGGSQIVIFSVYARVMNLSIAFNNKQNWQKTHTHIFVYTLCHFYLEGNVILP